MVSPLAPVLANLFMGDHEKDWLQKYKEPEVLFYRRYVDDTFCLFNNDNDASQFFDFINSEHTNIKFTMEKEENHKLPFLDVLVDNSHPDFLATSVFRKKTYTGLLTNFFSFTPVSYKIVPIGQGLQNQQHLKRLSHQHPTINIYSYEKLFPM